jgi:hypothetical protein
MTRDVRAAIKLALLMAPVLSAQGQESERQSLEVVLVTGSYILYPRYC